jgi:hypothetical protein
MKHARSLSLSFLVIVLGCGGKTAESDAPDSSCTTCVDSGKDTAAVDVESPPDLGPRPDTTPPDTSPPRPDGTPPPLDCFGPVKDPTNPPIECGPDPSIPKCSRTTEVATCPTDTACMARAKPTGTTLDFRIGRLRIWAPDALLSLSALAIDPNVNPKCDNNGNESLNWMIRYDTAARTVLTGGAGKSTDGLSFAMSHDTIDASALDAICPGFKGPATPISLAPATMPFFTESDGTFTIAPIGKLNIPIFDGAAPIILPLSEVLIKHARVSTDGACIGSWASPYWCDGDTLGWTTGGAITAKILVEDADRVPIKTAGCQSLCAILVNDASKTSGKLCKRGADGKIPAYGNSTLVTTNDSFLLSTTFAAYGVKITP